MLAFVDRPLGAREHRLEVRELGAEELVLAVAADDPLARRRRVRLAALAERDFVEYLPDSALRARIDAACEAVGLERRICCKGDTLTDRVELVAHGAGVSLPPPLALRTAAGRVTAIATEPPIPLELVVVTAADRPLQPAAAALLELLAHDHARV